MILDVLAGLALLGVAIAVRRSFLLASLGLAASVLWFVGDLAGPLVFAARGPLTHLLLVYPAAPRVTLGRLRTTTIAAAYAISLIAPLGRSGPVVLAFWALLLVCLWHDRDPKAVEPDSADRASRRLAAWCAGALWTALAVAAGLRLLLNPADPVLLAIYEIVVALIAVAIIADVGYRRWRPALIADLAVDLGEIGPRSLKDAVATALGDPELRIGFAAEDENLLDEHGDPLLLRPAPGRVVTELNAAGRRVGAIEHDASVRLDANLLAPITALIETAYGNVRLQAAVTDATTEVEASRLRLVSVADDERRALAHRIDAQVSSRLDRALAIAGTLDAQHDLADRVRASRQLLHDFARGVHPVLLDSHGLSAALGDLAQSSPVPVELDVAVGRLPMQVEATAYFVIAEALANATKHAHAVTLAVSVHQEAGRLIVTISDDGIGGAVVSPGGGLSGLRDRLDTIGGSLEIISPSASGTRLTAAIPLRS